jgi:hypothetical protein
MRCCILTVAFLLCLATPLVAQDKGPEVVVLPDAVMKQVVSRIVTWSFKPRRTQTTIYFSDKSIRKEWLPRIRKICFVLVKEEGYMTGRKGYVFSDVEREGKHYVVGFGYGDLSCGGYVGGPTWSVKVSRNRVRVWPSHGHWGQVCDENASTFYSLYFAPPANRS